MGTYRNHGTPVIAGKDRQDSPYNLLKVRVNVRIVGEVP